MLTFSSRPRGPRDAPLPRTPESLCSCDGCASILQSFARQQHKRHSTPPPRTCQRSHLTFLNAIWSAHQHFSSSASCTCEPPVWSMPAIPERIEFLKRPVILKKGLL